MHIEKTTLCYYAKLFIPGYHSCDSGASCYLESGQFGSSFSEECGKVECGIHRAYFFLLNFIDWGDLCC